MEEAAIYAAATKTSNSSVIQSLSSTIPLPRIPNATEPFNATITGYRANECSKPCDRALVCVWLCPLICCLLNFAQQILLPHHHRSCAMPFRERIKELCGGCFRDPTTGDDLQPPQPMPLPVPDVGKDGICSPRSAFATRNTNRTTHCPHTDDYTPFYTISTYVKAINILPDLHLAPLTLIILALSNLIAVNAFDLAHGKDLGLVTSANSLSEPHYPEGMVHRMPQELRIDQTVGPPWSCPFFRAHPPPPFGFPFLPGVPRPFPGFAGHTHFPSPVITIPSPPFVTSILATSVIADPTTAISPPSLTSTSQSVKPKTSTSTTPAFHESTRSSVTGTTISPRTSPSTTTSKSASYSSIHPITASNTKSSASPISPSSASSPSVVSFTSASARTAVSYAASSSTALPHTTSRPRTTSTSRTASTSRTTSTSHITSGPRTTSTSRKTSTTRISTTDTSTPTQTTDVVRVGNQWLVPGVGTFANRALFTFNNGFPDGLQISNYSNHQRGNGPSPEVPYNPKFDPANVQIVNGMLALTVPGHQKPNSGTGWALSSAEVTTAEQSILYGSVRTRAMLSPVPGTCHGQQLQSSKSDPGPLTLVGFFFYQSDTQEVDIEYLTDPSSLSNNGPGNPIPIWYTNQAVNPEDEAATQATGPSPSDCTTAVHEYRIDWTSDYTAFYLDGKYQMKFTTNVPSEPGPWVWNNWSNGNKGESLPTS